MNDQSPHARRRAAQRSVPDAHIELALTWGEPVPQPGGRVAWHLGRRAARHASRCGVPIPERAVGLAVVLAADGTLVTVIRSDDRRRLVRHGGGRSRPRGTW